MFIYVSRQVNMELEYCLRKIVLVKLENLVVI